MIGLPVHETLHLENIAFEAGDTTASHAVEETGHGDGEEAERCGYCDAFAQLSLALVLRSLEKTPHGNLTVTAAIARDAPFLGIRYAHSSGLDPPAAVV